MEIATSYRIDGRSFNREELLDHCREIVQDPATAAWYRNLFAFIHSFLDTGAGSILQRSSGTTGDPKEFVLQREVMVASARRTLDHFNLGTGERVLLCLPVDYIAGKMMVVRALAGGLDLVPREPSGRPLEGRGGEFSFAAMVPLQLHESLKAGDDLSAIQTLLVGGGDLHASLRTQLSGMDQPKIYESFGMTETYTHFALKRINGPSPDHGFLLLEGVNARTDGRGCLVVEVPGVTGGEVVTSDLVELDGQEGSFRWLGRYDNLISTGGIKVVPEILEERIGKLLQVECLVLPSPDKRLGQRLILVVEWPEREAPTGSWTALLRKELAPHEVPKQVFAVREIPRNASFKPDRTAVGKIL